MIIMSASSSSNQFYINSTSPQKNTGQAFQSDSYAKSSPQASGTYNIFGRMGNGQFSESLRSVLSDFQNALLSSENKQEDAESVVAVTEADKDNRGSKVQIYDLSHSQINVSDKNDTISGDNISHIQLNAKDGDDSISLSRASHSQLNAGGGNDTIELKGSSHNQVNAGDGDDVIKLKDSSHSQINAGDGNDTIELKDSSHNQVNAGNGDDVIKLKDFSHSQINAGDGNDAIELKDSSHNQVNAGNGDDVIRITNGVHLQVNNGAGNNTLLMKNISSSQINSGEGSDNIRIDGISSSQINLGDGDDVAVITNAYGVQLNIGDGNKDIIISGSGMTGVNLGNGNNKVSIYDSVSVSVSNFRSVGNDDIFFSNYTDKTGHASFSAGAGDDRFEVEGNYSAFIAGGTGNDFISLNLMMTGKTSTIGYSKGDGHDVVELKSGEFDFRLYDIRRDEIDISSSYDEKTGMTSAVFSLKDGSGSVTLLAKDTDAVRVIFGG